MLQAAEFEDDKAMLQTAEYSVRSELPAGTIMSTKTNPVAARGFVFSAIGQMIAYIRSHRVKYVLFSRFLVTHPCIYTIKQKAFPKNAEKSTYIAIKKPDVRMPVSTTLVPYMPVSATSA